nr:transposase [Duncaniella muris]
MPALIFQSLKKNLADSNNFFYNRSTNASAESINSKIKAFRAKLHGVNDTLNMICSRHTSLCGSTHLRASSRYGFHICLQHLQMS